MKNKKYVRIIDILSRHKKPALGVLNTSLDDKNSVLVTNSYELSFLCRKASILSNIFLRIFS